jgi:hypothetical protein
MEIPVNMAFESCYISDFFKKTPKIRIHKNRFACNSYREGPKLQVAETKVRWEISGSGKK